MPLQNRRKGDPEDTKQTYANNMQNCQMVLTWDQNALDDGHSAQKFVLGPKTLAASVRRCRVSGWFCDDKPVRVP